MCFQYGLDHWSKILDFQRPFAFFVFAYETQFQIPQLPVINASVLQLRDNFQQLSGALLIFKKFLKVYGYINKKSLLCTKFIRPRFKIGVWEGQLRLFLDVFILGRDYTTLSFHRM